MAARSKAAVAEPEVHPSVIVIEKINHGALAQAMRWANSERRTTAATTTAERALSDLVRTADEIATIAGDIPTDGRTTSPAEQERHAKKIERLTQTLGKALVAARELAAA